ncbi:hypothetical protein [Parafilimonas sp.]|jgi:hypothetical protein|uniref:hypothetical protein n=1 Tax=Parafilimonas sp. TaxID=1969739 RepID=UPI003F800071
MTSISQPESILKQKTKMFRFAAFALFVILMNAVINFFRGHLISSLLGLLFALTLCIVLYFIRQGKTKHIISILIISSDIFMGLLVFAEGLDMGGFLYYFALLFAIPFLLSNSKSMQTDTIIYLSFTVLAFCICILFCKRTSTWQHISLKTFPSRFTFNSITAAILCSVFAYIGIYFERKTKEELVEAKSRAEKQEQRVSEQNARLKDIAYLNAHIVRAPLANILALTSLIDETKIPDEETKELLHYLQESAEILDNNIKEIISKATYINP